VRAVHEWDEARALLYAEEGLSRFDLTRYDPAPAVRPYVSHHWVVSWDLRGELPHRQRVLTHPSVNMTFMPGRCRIAGVTRGQFQERLTGAGQVFGVMFRPGGFRPFLGRPVATITDRFVAIPEVFGEPGRELERAVLAAPEVADAIAAVGDFLAARAPADPSTVEQVAGMVARIAADPGLTQVGDLAERCGVTVRQLQRLFTGHVRVGAKWVIRRYRIHEAADRARDHAVNWADLAADLGYADQAHFTRDFSAAVGTTPTRYARECAVWRHTSRPAR
jgi:AraC-like DNA-binding protein